MKLLILGGTKFLGRHVTAAALAAGHTVTLFNRGHTNPDLFPQAEKLRGDRDGGLDALEGRKWDAAIDVNGYLPRVVRASAELLVGQVEHYTFISTISVYADPTQPGLNEDAPLASLEDESVEDIAGGNYGGLKVLCERVVENVFPHNHLIVRPGLIVGPHDPTDRFTYWPARIARGGQVLAPGDPERKIQFIDGRDLAEWVVELVENGVANVFTATGPAEPLTMGAFLEACLKEIESDAALTWLPDDFLLEKEVGPWMELPLWIPGEEGGLLATNISKALAAGLRFRALEDTIRDTLAWHQSRPADHEWGAGMKAEKEKELLNI